MQIDVNKEVLFEALFKLQGIIDKKHTLPILSNVLLEAKNKSLILTATDLEIGLQTECLCEVIEQGKTTVPAKKLFEIIKELPNQLISLKVKQNQWLEISCLKSVFNLVGLPPEEFPKFPTIKNSGDVINFKIFDEMIDSTLYSVSNDETKFNLTGIFVKKDVEVDEQISFVSTDGHRLSLIKKKIDNLNFENYVNGFILPKKGLIEFKKIFENTKSDIEISVNENVFSCKNENCVFIMRMIDGDFPDYKRVIPQKSQNIAIIDVKNFTNVIKRVSILSSDKSKGVKINFYKNNLLITSSNPEIGDAKEEMNIEYSGDEITIGFNSKYILDILNSIKSEKIDFYLKDNISPGMITPHNDENCLGVIMPMRL